MRRASFILAAIAALALVLSPGLAEARAGSSSSMGSRGGRTYTAPPSTSTAPRAAPMQRSLTPSTPQYGSAAGAAMPARPGGLFGGGFMSGLMGGLIGAGIGGLLFGHGFFGGMGSFGGFLGFLLQIFLLVIVVRFLIGLFRRNSPLMASGPGMGAGLFARRAEGQGGAMAGGGSGMAGGGMAAGAPIAITPADYQAFEQSLQAVQAAWSAQDLNALRGLVTPEMLGYFSEQLSANASRGVRNIVSDVRLEKGDLSEAWSESGREYATVAMRFSMTDVTVDGAGRVVDGSPGERVAATEFWTFLRAPGGRWLLSAIQQTG
jgi:predicted lipid-binding transport protein (Tim44 family)